MSWFEYDEIKSRTNREKHGIDFVQVQRIWDDPDQLVIPARTEDEPRFLAIGRIEGKPLVGCIHRAGNQDPAHFSPPFPQRGGGTL
jgi:uncharacterized DUF497 family protein